MDTLKIKKDFPIFTKHGDIAYLDNASSTFTPDVVIHAMNSYYEEYRANVHRGMYPIAVEATERYEQARGTIAEFLNAKPEEIIFTSGTTAGLNFLAASLGKTIKADENIVLTRLEHHANLIPWQEAAKRHGFEIRFIELDSQGKIDLGSAEKVIDEKTKVVSMTAISNAIGTIVPLEKIIALAREKGARVVVDAAQLVAHAPVDVKRLDCDFLVFSGHKMYGPTGIGVVYGKEDRLLELEPASFGGEMIEEVSYEKATWAKAPHKFEAGTPNIAGAIGLATAFVYLSHLRWESIEEHEEDLKKYLLSKLREHTDVVGPALASERGGVVSFTIPGVHPHDAADILGKQGVCVRAGHHCAMPLMKYLNLSGTIRASLGFYNSREDVDRLVEGIRSVRNIFNGTRI